MKRRQLLKLFGVAPAVILTPGLLMPVKKIIHNDGIMLNSIQHPGFGLAALKPEGGDIIYDPRSEFTINGDTITYNGCTAKQLIACTLKR